MNNQQIMEMIKEHEGFRDHVYVDTVGVLTGGYGHAFLEGSPIPPVVADLLFENDFKMVGEGYDYFVDQHGLELNNVRRAVIMDMLFNLGLPRLSRFVKMIKAMQASDWAEAAAQMLDSKWATQVGRRAIRLSEMMEKGV